MRQLLDPEEFLQEVARLKKQPEQRGRTEIYLRDGRVFDRYTAPIRDGHGELFGRVWFIRDVTERRQALQDLENVVARTRCILWQAEVVGEAGWEQNLDCQGDPFRWKIRLHDERVAQQVLALDVAEGETYAEAFGRNRHPEDKWPTYQTSARAILRGEDTYSQDFRCYDKHGTLHWVHEDVSLQNVGPGRWRAFGASMDITEQRRAEETRAELAAIVEWSGDGIIGVNPDGSIVSWNRGAQHIFGYSADEIIGRSLQVLAPPDGSGLTAGIFASVAAGTAAEHFEAVGERETSAFSTLTSKQREVLQLLSEGKSNKEVASCLSISAKTVETHRAQIMEKLQIRTIAGLTKYAIREGLTSIES